MKTLWPRLVQWLLVLTLPVLLFVVDLRVVTSHWFVSWEYGKPGFPADPYGFSRQERTHLAGVCVDYLATQADISLLADLRLAGGEPAFNERELSHMVDVQLVYGWMMVAGLIVALVWVGGVIALLVSASNRRRVFTALLGGSLLLLGLLTAVGAFMLLSWREFFVGFHNMFFAEGTWTFLRSDTLIRLFPEQFWMDVGATIVGLLVVEVFVFGVVGWLGRRRRRAVTRDS